MSGNDVQIGQALRRAKWKYYAQQRGDDVVHPKVAMQMTLYGLPMTQLHSAISSLSPERTLTDEDAFPSMSVSNNISVTFGCGLNQRQANGHSLLNDDPFDVVVDPLNPRIALCGFVKSIEHFSFGSNALPSAILSKTADVSGTSYSLNGRVSLELGESVQPRFYYTLTRPESTTPVRSVWIISTTYETIKSVTATLTTVTNEYDSVQVDVPTDAWDNSDLVTVRSLPGQDTLIAFMGQGNHDAQQIRLTRAMSVEVYYSNMEDTDAPRLTSVAIDRSGAGYAVKAKLGDSNVIARVGVLFTDGLGEWHTQDLSFDVASQSWVGTVSATSNVSFAVQALDTAGNVGRFTNKGRYYRESALVGGTVYLPAVVR